jgi:MFS transporter, SP family, arabinose:H+ symporter
VNTRLIFWSITSALAGFIFGFDTVVISGAGQKIQSLWGLSPGMHGIAMAAALYGTVAGALLGGWPAERFGRKRTLIGIGVLYVVSAIGSAGWGLPDTARKWASASPSYGSGRLPG